MDAERLTEIRERWAAATPGPWCHRHANDGVKRTPLPEVCSEGAARGDWCPTVASTSYDEAIANAAAIAAAPTDIADLLAEVERLRVTMEVAIEHYDLMLEDGFHDCEAWEEVRDRLVRAIRGSEIEGGEPRNLEVIP